MNLRPDAEKARQQTVESYQILSPELLRTARWLSQNEMLAQDAVQEVYLRFFLALIQGEMVRDQRAWLHRVLRNLLLDAKRFDRTHRQVSLERCSTETVETCELLDFEWRGTAERILAPREWECLQLRAEGFEYKEIACALHIRTGTVAALLNRAINKLRAVFVRSEGWA